MEVASPMGKASRLPEARLSVGTGFIELCVALVRVGLEDAARVTKVGQHMLRFPVGCVAIEGAGRSGASPGALVTDIPPDPTLHHALADAFGTQFRVQHADGCIVGVKEGAA